MFKHVLIIRSLVTATLIGIQTWCFAQTDSVRVFELGAEFRPRFEFRDGYKQLPSNTTTPAAFISSRSRLSMDFKQRRNHFHMSIQDVRFWGQDGNAPSANGIGVFEAYATLGIKKHWRLKLGRQAVELDNGRLFSKANWNQWSRAHDGLRLTFEKGRLITDLLAFYNQSGANLFGNTYNLNFYKYLVVHNLDYVHNEHWYMKTLNSFDGYQSQTNDNVVYVRGTSGGRITYKSKPVLATVSAYYQYGQLQNGRQISAYYIQPEVDFRYKKKLVVAAGMEYLSGNDNGVFSEIDRSFNTLYGVAFKFMGHLDYFTSFPNDVNGTGLINPYLFLDYQPGKKFRVKLQPLLFFTQSQLLNFLGEEADPYLGFECDLKLKYTFSPDLFLDFGFSAMVPTESMSILKTGDYRQTPLFSFLMLTWKPTLIHLEQPAF